MVEEELFEDLKLSLAGWYIELTESMSYESAWDIVREIAEKYGISRNEMLEAVPEEWYL